MKKTQVGITAFAVALGSSAFASPITVTNFVTGHSAPGAGTFLPYAGPDGFVSGGGTYNNTDLFQSSTGDYTYLLPTTSESGQMYSFTSTTFAVGDNPLLITSFDFGGNFRTVASGGVLGNSNLSLTSGVVNVFNEGTSLFGGPTFYNGGVGHGPVTSNTFGDFSQAASATSLIGLILVPHTSYTFTEAMVTDYSLTRPAGDNFSYGLTEEYGGFGPAGNSMTGHIGYQALPEPASMGAILLGVGGLLARRRRKAA